MKKIQIAILVSILNIGICGSVAGTVYDSDSKEKIRAANILVIDTDSGTSTDENGEFLIQNLQPGLFEIEFNVIGYQKQRITVEVEGEGTTNLSAALKPLSLILDQITVTGLSKSQLSFDLPVVISKQEIDRLNSSSLTDVLRNQPGIDIQTAHSLGRNVNLSIRGSSDYKPGGYNNRVMVMMDGMPVQIPNSGAVDWNAIPIDNVEEIEIAKGPASALYGHNSMGGTINLITSSPVVQDYSQLSSHLSYGTFDKLSGLIQLKRHSRNISNALSVSTDRGEGHRFNSNYNINRVSHKLLLSRNDMRSLSISNTISSSLNGQPGFLRDDGKGISYRVSERISAYNQIHLRSKITNSIGLNLSAAINRFETDYYDRDDTPENKAEESTYYRDSSVSLRTELSYKNFDRLNWIVGYEFGYDVSDASVLNTIYNSPSQLTSAPFIQLRYMINSMWLLGAGTRYDYRYVDPGSSYGTRTFNAISPKLNLTYMMKGERIFQLSANKGFRAPSISELYLDHVSPYGLPLKGNSTLSPESMWSLEMSYNSHFLNDVKWSMSLFYNYYEQMIDFVYTYPVKSKNRNNIEGVGSELSLSYTKDKLALSFDYTFLNMNDLNATDPILYRPRHKANVSVALSGGRWMALLSGRYKSSQMYEDFIDQYTQEGDEYSFPLKELPQTLILSSVVKYYLGSATISILINNLLDTSYSLIQDYPMPGRTLELKINYKLNKKGSKK